ncbi:divalent-cation tolerance protein CutA-like isoform X2 [Varroa jacobsoni]|uniref:divalent-cation tolerance protein CutA-like isoform X2 n=2 Tax=Varroa jacobsoni TaxID=62625 RepID=UPI000BF82ED8|nr:divalent-cation tolerance protein CutA-like isoform X2 [Varroa jacobsoni]
MPKSRQVLLGCFSVLRLVSSTACRDRAFSMSATEIQQAGAFSVSYVTAPSKDVAEKIASGLVENRLAACVNIIPGLTSIYRWKGTIEKDNEVLLMIKSPSASLANLTTFVKSLHPYEVCEIISLPIQQGNPDYLQFLMDATAGGKH